MCHINADMMLIVRYFNRDSTTRILLYMFLIVCYVNMISNLNLNEEFKTRNMRYI